MSMQSLQASIVRYGKYTLYQTSVSETIRKPPLVKAQTALKTQNNKIWRKRFSIWRMEFLILTPCNVAGGSGMTCHWIRPNVRHIGILHLVSISTTSPQSTCHSAPVSEILPKSDHPGQKIMTSCRFSRWRISAMLDFMDPIMGSLKSPIT